MIVVDGHLDLAFNRLAVDRDPRESALVTRARSVTCQPPAGPCTIVQGTGASPTSKPSSSSQATSRGVSTPVS